MTNPKTRFVRAAEVKPGMRMIVGPRREACEIVVVDHWSLPFLVGVDWVDVAIQPGMPMTFSSDDQVEIVDETPPPDRALIKDRAFMSMAKAAATMGTCSRLQVGAVIVTDRIVVSTGYNGAPMGTGHCGDHSDGEKCDVSSHAELNAALFAGRPKALGGTMYTTHSPCWECASAILQVGITEVVYAEPYRDDAGLRRLQDAGVIVRQLEVDQ